MNLADVLDKYPQTAEVLIEYGLHCIGCAASAYDTIEAGAKMHALTDQEIDDMVAQMNSMLE